MSDLPEIHGFLLSGLDEACLSNEIVQAFGTLYNDDFSNAFMGVNHELKTELRGWQVKTDWAQGGLLTPWMLAIIYFPLNQNALKDLILPQGWTHDEREHQSYQVIGPTMSLQIEDKAYPAHLNYHPQLGHYWLRPLVQNMARYSSNDMAFEAWSEVLAFRKAIREQRQAEEVARKEKQQHEQTDQAQIDQHKAVSRRAVLAKWFNTNTNTNNT